MILTKPLPQLDSQRPGEGDLLEPERSAVDLAGEPNPELAFSEKDVRQTGHAIEFRINAENPYKDFTPSPGKVSFVHFPGGPGVRIDSHVYSGYEIAPHYDSMIGKVIVHGRTRQEAIAKLSRALNEFMLEGAHTTVPLGQALLGDSRFARGEYNTSFLDTFMKEVFLITPQ